MRPIFLPEKVSQNRVREAETARKNRQEFLAALSQGKLSRRELLRLGLMTAGGTVAHTHGLSPFVNSAYAAVPTGMPRSPLFGALPFTQPMPRADVLPRKDPASLSPAPMVEANTTQQLLNIALPGVKAGDTGPIEGRPPGPMWAHQEFDLFKPKVAVEVTQEPVKANSSYNPGVPSQLNSGINAAATIAPRFHPNMPLQQPNSVWTFNGTVPPKLMLGRYGEPILFRHHNRLPFDMTQNNGFGRHTLSTHEHNGHHGAENDGFTGAYFYPGQFYDYHYPIVLAGWRSINANATDARAGTPNDAGGIDKIPGDWRETMSTHWFHDHMFSFTMQNVYKGNAGMFNLYSAVDRGNEAIDDGVNLRLPSGTANPWGNLDYDVNLVVADKAFNASGQLTMDIFDVDGFVGDVMTVNYAYKPYFEVERRKYRFRILCGSIARFMKLALSDGSPMILIANDGNLLPAPVVLTELDEQSTGERVDVVIDFSRYSIGSKVRLVNLAEHSDGRRVAKDLTLREALSGKSDDPCVGPFLEFRVMRNPSLPDQSQVPAQLIPNPDHSVIPVARTRVFEFGRGAAMTTYDDVSSYHEGGPWGMKVEGGPMLAADFGRISAAPKAGTREVWVFKNGGGGWDHPIHIHFEEGQILQRDGSASNVPPWERGRKDVYRLRPGGTCTISVQFRDFGGMFMQHCHNTVHEDNAMLMRWEMNPNGSSSVQAMHTPIPSPQGVTFRPPTEILPNAY